MFNTIKKKDRGKKFILNPAPLHLTSRKYKYVQSMAVQITNWHQGELDVIFTCQLPLSGQPHNLTIWHRSSLKTEVSAEAFCFHIAQSHCGACRKRWLLREIYLCSCDNVSHCQLTPSDQFGWRFVQMMTLANLGGWTQTRKKKKLLHKKQRSHSTEGWEPERRGRCCEWQCICGAETRQYSRFSPDVFRFAVSLAVRRVAESCSCKTKRSQC